MYRADSAPFLLVYATDEDGTLKTDLTAATAGLTLSVRRSNLTGTLLTPADGSSETDHGAGKIYHLGGGLYSVGIATATISSYDGWIVVTGSYTGGTINGVPDQVSNYDPSGAVSSFDASTDSVDLNADQSAVTIGTVTTNTDMRGTDSAFLAASAPTNFSSLGINGSGHISQVTLVDTTTLNTDMRGTDSAFLAASAPTNFSSLGINGSGHIDRVTLVDTTTTNADMRGTDSALTSGSFPDNFASLGITADGYIERVVLTDTTTTNTDMRGTDSASTHDAAAVVTAMVANASFSTLFSRIDVALTTAVASVTVADYAANKAPILVGTEYNWTDADESYAVTVETA